jgi:hypothetical protein
MWYEFDSIDDFNVWHTALCESLGYPITPINAETGLPDETAQKVTDYTTPIIVDEKVIAVVEAEYSNGLKATELRPPEPELALPDPETQVD